MRHFLFQAPAIASLAVGMFVAPREAGLIALAGRALGFCPGQRGTTLCAIDIATVTTTADHYLTTAAGTVVESSAILHRQSPSEKNYAGAGRAPTTARYCAADRV
jgi:hypothetical protein